MLGVIVSLGFVYWILNQNNSSTDDTTPPDIPYEKYRNVAEINCDLTPCKGKLGRPDWKWHVCEYMATVYILANDDNTEFYKADPKCSSCKTMTVEGIPGVQYWDNSGNAQGKMDNLYTEWKMNNHPTGS